MAGGAVLRLSDGGGVVGGGRGAECWWLLLAGVSSSGALHGRRSPGGVSKIASALEESSGILLCK